MLFFSLGNESQQTRLEILGYDISSLCMLVLCYFFNVIFVRYSIIDKCVW